MLSKQKIINQAYQGFEKTLVEFFCRLIRSYQAVLSPDHGIFKKPYGHCRFYPTCSQYALEALQGYGLWKGAWYTGKRLLKCNPFHAPMHDPLPHRSAQSQ